MRIILYFCAALAAMLVNMAIRFVLSKWIPFAAAVFIAYWGGHVVNFLLSNTVVFKGRAGRNMGTTFLKFTLVACMGFVIIFIVSLVVRFVLEKFFRFGIRSFGKRSSTLRESVAHSYSIMLDMFCSALKI